MRECPKCFFPADPHAIYCANPNCGVALPWPMAPIPCAPVPGPPVGGDDELASWFAAYHQKHPEVYAAFRDMAREIRREGHKRYGAKTIMERLRWETPVRYGGEFKLSNTVKDRCSARYARMLIAEDPTFSTFFELRPVSTTESRARMSEGHKR